MTSWKRCRGWSEAHGWGSDDLARLIGRQRREARRPTGAKPLLVSPDDAVLAAEVAFIDATTAYEAAPLRPEAFDPARAAYVRAEQRLEEARRSSRSCREPNE
jgi:hypothetical protein